MNDHAAEPIDARMIEAIRAEVARTHKVILGDNDPILMTATLNRLILEHYLSRMESAVSQGLDEFTATVSIANDESKAAAERLVTGAGQYASKAIKTAADSVVEQVSKQLAGELQQYVGVMKATLQQAQVETNQLRTAKYWLIGGAAALWIAVLLQALIH